MAGEFDKEDLDSLKTNPAILRVYGSYTQLRREGSKYTGLCPLHSEKTPSFVVFQKDMMWTCFGGCGNGNAFQLIMKKDNCDFKTAVAKVREFVGENNWSKDAERVDATFRPAVESTKTYKSYELHEYVQFEKALAQNPAALNWLFQERGVTAETAKKLHLGYRRDVGRLAGEKNADIADKGWVAFPCIEDSKVVSLKYRSIARKCFCKQPGMASALFNTESIDLFAPVMLVEGDLDAAVLVQAGFNAVSLQSASTYPTPQQKDQLMRAESVILAGDNDGAVGSSVMEKLWRELAERTYLLRWPVGTKDANQFFLETCKRDLSIFRTRVQELTAQARKMVMPDVFSIQDVMIAGGEAKLTEHPDRFRFPQPDLDKMAILLPGSVLGVYATQTGQGKTAFTVQATLHNARKYNKTVLNWQCELSPEEIGTMIAAQVLKKDRNTLTAEDRKEAAHLLGEAKYYVGYNPNMRSHDEVLDLIEAAARRLGASVVVLDTFNNVVVSETNATAIETVVANRAKSIAKKLGLVWINVFQPRKANQQTKGKRTHITDIRGAGAAADTCDAVFAIHRDLARHDDEVPADDVYEPKTLIQAQKTRAKGTGKAETYLTFFGQFASFEQVDPYHENNSDAYSEPVV